MNDLIKRQHQNPSDRKSAPSIVGDESKHSSIPSLRLCVDGVQNLVNINGCRRFMIKPRGADDPVFKHQTRRVCRDYRQIKVKAFAGQVTKLVGERRIDWWESSISKAFKFGDQ